MGRTYPTLLGVAGLAATPAPMLNVNVLSPTLSFTVNVPLYTVVIPEEVSL